MGATVEFFKKYGKCIYLTKSKDKELAKFPPIVCADGLFISAQAGINYKCYPRENLDTFEYETVEVFKDEDLEKESLISPFVCSYDNYVFADVPVEVIDEIISRHGGIDYSKVDKYINKKDEEENKKC